MDTPSHICMGAAVGLCAATIANNSGLEVNTTSVVVLSIIANSFPDIDVIFKLKSNYSYINYHRGFSHSVLFAFIWIILLSVLGFFFNGAQHYFFYLIVAALGIGLHLFTDLLNGYGVQFLWPFKRKWIAFGLTYTFDVLLFTLHAIAFAAIFLLGAPVLVTFGIIYAILIAYIISAYFYHYYLKQQLVHKYGKLKRLILQSRSTPFKWKYVYETYDKNFYMGLINKKTITQLRYEKRMEVLDPELEKELMKDKKVKAFIDFTPIFNYEVSHEDDGSMVIKFYDLRYLMVKNDNQYYIFNCIAKVKDNVILKSYIGFTVAKGNEEKKFDKIKEKKQMKEIESLNNIEN